MPPTVPGVSAKRDDTDPPYLTKRERVVLGFIVQGLTISEISERTYRTENTIKRQVVLATRRFRARNTVHTIALAHSAGLLDIGCSCDDGQPPDQLTIAEVNVRSKARAKSRLATNRAAPVPPALYKRWPSLRWGEREWFAVLKIDNDLYFRILRGIGKAYSRSLTAKQEPHRSSGGAPVLRSGRAGCA